MQTLGVIFLMLVAVVLVAGVILLVRNDVVKHQSPEPGRKRNSEGNVSSKDCGGALYVIQCPLDYSLTQLTTAVDFVRAGKLGTDTILLPTDMSVALVLPSDLTVVNVKMASNGIKLEPIK